MGISIHTVVSTAIVLLGEIVITNVENEKRNNNA